MAFWAVRAGSTGEREAFALESSCVVIGWDSMPDLTRFNARPELRKAISETHPDISEAKLSVWTGEMWSFSHEIREGDLVALPRRHSGTIAFGTIAGAYRFDPSGPERARHQRPVRWINPDFPRLKLDEDIRFSLGSTLTVFQVRRNAAEERMRSALEGKIASTGSKPTIESLETEFINIERQARDRIIAHIGRKFKKHDLERLVEAILNAQGFVTDRTAPGADGGVDILAGRGELGFEPPRLAVQIKSSENPVEVVGARVAGSDARVRGRYGPLRGLGRVQRISTSGRTA